MSEVKIKKIEKRLISLEKQVEEIQKILDKTYGNSLSLANKNKEKK
jgi:wobble nucleotide-excising tRNase